MDSSPDTPGKVLYKKRFYPGAPILSEVPEDRQQLLEYIKYFVALHKIEHVFPGTSEFVNFLKENEEFIGAKVITSTLETCIVSRSKRLTYKTLGRVMRVPRVFKMDEVAHDVLPLFLEHDRGSGNIGRKRVDTMEELVSCYDREKHVLREQLPGKEYFVDCLTGPDGQLLYHCPRERTATRDGISVVNSAVTGPETLTEKVREMTHGINDSIEFKGAWSFQVVFSGDGPLCLVGISPCFTGDMCFSRMSGANLALFSLNISEGIRVRMRDFENFGHFGQFGHIEHPEHTMKVYKTFMDPLVKFDNLYVDLDDTLVIKGRVNPDAMACLYRHSSRGVPIHLITRRPSNLKEYLRCFHIPESIFTSIQQIFNMGPKSEYIVPNSVFVDDSFEERQRCSSVEKNIRCFDIDAFPFL